jgi:hypothetical protein
MRKRWKAAGAREIHTEDSRVDFDGVQARRGIRGGPARDEQHSVDLTNWMI